ncbi:MAG TPA: vWA domain-containing protein [Polyangiaceae bacterium]|nr:vWA domain-containing protein [Polyangiaceae bacterium]
MVSFRAIFLVLGLGVGCGGSTASPPSGLGRGETEGAGSGGTDRLASAAGISGAGGATTGGTSGNAPATITVGGSTSVGDDDPSGIAGNDDTCAKVTASAELEPVFLAFAFDVSGSMGKGDHPWHDATLKWDPVVAATRAFFEDPKSSGLTASLTAFPIDAGDDERCDPDSYTDPDVSMRALPSTAFGAALDAIRAEDWRGGTPTLAVVQGVLEGIDVYRMDHPGRYALVLVTDGYPQDCDDDSIESVEAAVRSVAGEIPTYVVGVKNPPLTDDDGNMAPDTVSNLAGVAEAGGTDHAFIIDTGDPTKTTSAFAAAVEQIRGHSISCELDLPKPPDGRVFQKDHVEVTFQSDSGTTTLTYDADCTQANGWHYDDASKPTKVSLCPKTCDAVTSTASARLAVGFTCQPVIAEPR